MTRLNGIQTSFVAGELSPLLEMVDDIELRTKGARRLENWYPHLQGPIVTVAGSEYVSSHVATTGRAFPFPVGTFQAYAVVVTPTEVLVTDSNGYNQDDNQLLNGDFQNGPADWTALTGGQGQVLFVDGSCELIPSLAIGGFAAIQQVATVTAATPQTVAVQVVDGLGPILVQVGSSIGALNDIHSAIYSGTAAIRIMGLVSATTEMAVTLTNAGQSPIKVLSSVWVLDETVPATVISFPSPWTTAEGIASMQALSPPGEVTLYMTSLTQITHILQYDKVTRIWIFGPAVFVNPPAEWVAGNYPAAIEFFEGRLYLAGTNDQQETLWASKPNVNGSGYLDFTIGTLADDALSYTMNKRGHIHWMVGSLNLVVGTSTSEHILTSEGGIIIPGDVTSRIQSANGSAPTQAVSAGNNILYVSADGKKIRSMGFEWTKDAWLSRDLTFAAEHLTAVQSMKTIHFAFNPFSLLLSITREGDIIGASYETLTQSAGFFRRTTQGRYVDVCVLSFGGVDELWGLVDRNGEGGNLVLERIVLNPPIKLDSFTRIVEAVATTSFSVPHLADKTCQVIADGAVHPDVLVGLAGEVELEYPANSLTIGLGFTATMESMSLGNTIKNVGTARPMKKRWNKLWVRITSSWKPLINGQRAPNRHPATPMGEMEPARTENVQVSLKGWDEEGTITIEQDLPVVTNVAGFFGQITEDQV